MSYHLINYTFGLKGCNFLNFYSAYTINSFLFFPSYIWWLSLNYCTEVHVLALYLFYKLNIFYLYFSSYIFFFMAIFLFSTYSFTPATTSHVFSFIFNTYLFKFFIFGWNVHSTNSLYSFYIFILFTMSYLVFLFGTSFGFLFTIYLLFLFIYGLNL